MQTTWIMEQREMRNIVVYWFKKVELVAHLKRELCVKEGNGWKGKGKGEDGENEQE